jgi:tRNA dimethylallyltransferase
MPSLGSDPLSSVANGSPIFLAGPTAVGKSEVALLLAEQLNGEIITVDSMQVYRGLDIGTAKPNATDRQRIPHHLLDVVNLTESFDAAKFVLLARKAIEEIQKRRRIPILCGGTGLYFKALLEGLGDAPPADPNLRRELEAKPLNDLLMELAREDPVTFERIDRRNARRVIRALEVLRLTGQPFSVQRAEWKSESPGFANSPPGVLVLTRASDDLRGRIDARVEEMFSNGLVAETEQLLQRGLAENRTAMQAIGYRQVVEHLRGAHSLAETIALVKVRTRQFAKRQGTWFRRQLPSLWISCRPEDRAPEVARQIEKILFPAKG